MRLVQATHHHRMSMTSSLSLAFRHDRSLQYLPSVNSPGTPSTRYHPAPSSKEVAIVQPVIVSVLSPPLKYPVSHSCTQVKQLDVDLLTTIQFLPRSLLTSCKTGLIKLWVRPLALRPRQLKSARLGPLIDAQDLS